MIIDDKDEQTVLSALYTAADTYMNCARAMEDSHQERLADQFRRQADAARKLAKKIEEDD
jgi:hypothetical protein